MTTYCANDGCETEATHYVFYPDGTKTPLCFTCMTAYEWGQTNPTAEIATMGDVSTGNLFVDADGYVCFESSDGYNVLWWTLHTSGWQAFLDNDVVWEGENTFPSDEDIAEAHETAREENEDEDD